MKRRKRKQSKGYAYNRYLLGQKWKAFRITIFAERGAKCERCRSIRHLELHHKTYKRLGNEDPADVEILCRVCHEAHHNRTPAIFNGPRVGYEFLEGKPCAAPLFR